MNTRRSTRAANIKTQDVIPIKRNSEPEACEKVTKIQKKKLCVTPVFVSKKKSNQSKNPQVNPEKNKCSHMKQKNVDNMSQTPTANHRNESISTPKTKGKRVKDATQKSTSATTNEKTLSRTRSNFNTLNIAVDPNCSDNVQSQPCNYSKDNMNASPAGKTKRNGNHIEILENILLSPIKNFEQFIKQPQYPFSNKNISNSQTPNKNLNDDSNTNGFNNKQVEVNTPKRVYRSQRLANKQKNKESKQNNNFEDNIPTVDLTSDGEKEIRIEVVKKNKKRKKNDKVVNIKNPQKPQRNIGDILDFDQNSAVSAQCNLKSILSEKPGISENRMLPNHKLLLEPMNIETANCDTDFEFESCTSSLPNSVAEFIETIFESDKIIYNLSQSDISRLATALNIEVDFLKSTLDNILKISNRSPNCTFISSNSNSLVQCSQSPEQRRFRSQTKNN